MKQFIKFGIVGLSNTVISYLIYVVSLRILGACGLFPDSDYMISSVIAFILSVLWSFYWNDRFTFKKEQSEERSFLRSLLKTYVSYSFTGLLLYNILLYVQVDIMGVSKLIAPIFNLLVTVPLNFLLNKFWVFRKNRQ